MTIENSPVQSLARFTHGLLAHRADAGLHLNAALVADPDYPEALLAKGFAGLISGNRSARPAARVAVKQALASLAGRGGSARDFRLASALALWAIGRQKEAALTLDAVLADAPLDAMTLKLSHQLHFMLGENDQMRQVLSDALAYWSPDMPNWGYLQGCLAFALEETGDHAAAERIGRDACERNADDVWAAHAVAHTFEMRGQPAQGLAWLDASRAALEGCSSFAFHVLWHRALFLIERGSDAAALAIYDEELRPQAGDDYRDFCNLASLLWRFQAVGLSVGPRWRELADAAEARIGNNELVFADLHVGLVLVRGDRPDALMRLAASLAADARQKDETQAPIASETGLPALRGLAAIGLGETAVAVRLLSDGMPSLQALGGSHAQRDLFVQCLAHACAADENQDALAAVMARRASLRPASRFMELLPAAKLAASAA